MLPCMLVPALVVRIVPAANPTIGAVGSDSDSPSNSLVEGGSV